MCIYIYIHISAYDKKKTQQQPPEIQMASNTDINIITGTKLKYLSDKENEYGTNHFFQLLDITNLQELTELRNSMKMLIWEYNNKFHLTIHAVKIKEAKVEHGFNKDHPYIMDLTFSNMIS